MRKRRSGIANIVGAVFFILIVVLMVGVIAATFGTFNDFIGSQHTSNEQTLQAQQASLNVQNLTFGGLMSYGTFNFRSAVPESLSGTLNSMQNPILPISNMNFTNGAQGWGISTNFTSYSGFSVNDTGQFTRVNDKALVQNGPQTLPNFGTPNSYCPSVASPSSPPTSFCLTVTNDNPAGSAYQIAKVSVLADANLVLTLPQPVTPNWGPCSLPACLGLPPSVVGDNVTWVAPTVSAIGGGGSEVFMWSASPPSAPGTVYDTVVISWIDVLLPGTPFVDTAIATVNSTISSTAVVQSGVSSGVITPPPSGTAGGISAGYDGNSVAAASSSGPGSLYFDFQPSLNLAPISDQQQLTGTASFSSSFSLDTATARTITTTGCCSLSWESSLNSLTSVQNPLIVYQVFLTNPMGVTILLPIGGNSCAISPTNPPIDYLNPAYVNHFGPSGWFFDHACFDPSSINPTWLTPGPGPQYWYAGSYTLSVKVTETIPGAFAGNPGYPPSVSVSLDDIGLALKPTATSYYGSTQTNTPSDFRIPTGLNRTMVQGMELVINATGALQNTTIYAYVADNSHFVYNPTPWVQIGSATFSSSGIIDAVIPLPNAAYYVNSTNDCYRAAPPGGAPCSPVNRTLGYITPEIGFIDVRVNATSPYGPFALNVTVQAVVQTLSQTRLAVSLKNEGPTPLHLTSMVITGSGSAYSFNFPANYFIGTGEKLIIPETFTWLPDQVYTVTVTASTGLTFSRSFSAPLS